MAPIVVPVEGGVDRPVLDVPIRTGFSETMLLSVLVAHSHDGIPDATTHTPR